MTIIVKSSQENISNEYYELFEIKTQQDVDGNDVQIPVSIGKYSVNQLKSENDNYQSRIDSNTEKINAINASLK